MSVLRIPNSEDGEPNVQHQHDGTVRTQMNCHACTHEFMALVDHGVDASIVIECPHCGHLHYRKVTAGIVTEDREGHGGDPEEKFKRKVKTWKHESLPVKTQTTTEFLRHRWLNRLDRQAGR